MQKKSIGGLTITTTKNSISIFDESFDKHLCDSLCFSWYKGSADSCCKTSFFCFFFFSPFNCEGSLFCFGSLGVIYGGVGLAFGLSVFESSYVAFSLGMSVYWTGVF